MENKKINICMGSSCAARGNTRNLELIRTYIREAGLEAQIELGGTLCQGKCKEGPNITINDVLYSEVDSNSLIDILNHCFGR